MFQRESRHPHEVQLLALAQRFPIPCLYFALPSFSQPARNGFHSGRYRPLAISDPSGQCGAKTSNSRTFLDILQHAGMQAEAYSQGLWPTRLLQGTLLGNRWMSIACSPRVTTETARRNHPLLPLTPPPTALPSMRGLAPPSNMLVVPPPPIQLQIDPALQATAPPQVTLTPPSSSSINARANP